jgi:CRP-like cAMP-binding protein
VALEDDIRRLARVPLLAELELDALRLLAFSAEARILRTGDVVFRAGDPTDSGYFIMSGSIALETPGRSPAKKVVGPGSLVGELALLVDSARPATATSREPTTVLKISRALFRRILTEYPSSAAKIRNQTAARLKEFVEDLERMPGFREP